MAIHTHYDVAFLMTNGTVHIGRTTMPRNFIMKHLQGRVRGTAGLIKKVIGYVEIEFDTDATLDWAEALMEDLAAEAEEVEA